MRRNTMSLVKYNIFTGIWTLAFFAFYRYYMFISLRELGLVRSNLLLAAILIAVYLINILISGRYARNKVSAVLVIALSFGIYTFIGYKVFLGELFLKIVMAAAVLMVICLGAIFFKRMPNRKSHRRIIRNRLRMGYLTVRDIAAGCGIVLIAVVFVQVVLFGSVLRASSVKPTKLYGDEYAMEKNMDTFLLLQDEEWKKLDGDYQKKLDILQTVVNCEGRYLSFNRPINVVAEYLGSSTWAYYSDNDGRIVVNERILDRPSEDVLKSVLHECYHCAQHQYVEIYKSLDGSDQENFFMMEAATYADEIENYADGTKDYHEYYSQRLEADARAYGITSTTVIFSRIEEYLKAQEQPD